MKTSSKGTANGRILSSSLARIIAVLLFVAAVLIFVSIICLFTAGKLDYIREAISSHGIIGRGTIDSYLVLHIAARLVLLTVSAVFSFGMLYTLVTSKRNPEGLPGGVGFSAMIKLVNCVHKLVIPLGAVLATLFVFKLIVYLVLCFRNRYNNFVIFSFFATIFGELLLALIAAGVLYWIYRFSSAAVDDLTSIQYSLTARKSSAYSISTSSFFSLCACAVISLALAFAMSYDIFAFAAFAVASIANLIAAFFMKSTKRYFEELAYKEYIENSRSSGKQEEMSE